MTERTLIDINSNILKEQKRKSDICTKLGGRNNEFVKGIFILITYVNAMLCVYN